MSQQKAEETKIHQPAMVMEVLRGLKFDDIAPLKTQDLSVERPKKVLIDATLGGGGHAEEIIKRGGFVLGIDADERMIEVARENLELACPAGNPDNHFRLVNDNFRNLDIIASEAGIGNVDGILFDLGISSYHLDSDQRGFSFQNPSAKLDMRLSPSSQAVTASMLLNSLSKKNLIELLSQVMPVKASTKLADGVIRKRKYIPIEKVEDFLSVVRESKIERKRSKLLGSIKEGTLPFLALRMAVNSELENLSEALKKAYGLLKGSGRLVVISFHSGEDRIVKSFFKEMQERKKGVILTKKPLTPGFDEINTNPRSRSAKLRVFEKI
jgi:16S rRNA (cytosine1402-N4)-methyltransferase